MGFVFFIGGGMNNTDKQLLERAAKAANISIDQDGAPWIPDMPDGGFNTGRDWNPLESDSDAFRLMVDLRITVDYYDGFCEVWACAVESFDTAEQPYTNNRAADTRRAITMAAAVMIEDSE